MKAFLPTRHTGKLAHHTHTSYAGLAFLLVLVTLFVVAFGLGAQAGEGDTEGGGVAGIFATVPAKVPGATIITSPRSGTQVDTMPVSVAGSCSAGSTVKVFKNGIVAGATTCRDGGSYSVPIDLFFGNNSLVAQAFNVQDVSGPSSPAVGVQFAPLSGPLASQFQLFNTSSALANQLFIKADTFHQAVGAGNTKWRLELVGGTAPYALSVSWGDGATDVYSRSQAGVFDVQHHYSSAASRDYDVIAKVRDSAGNAAYLQLVAVGAVAGSGGKSASDGLVVVWPLLALAAVAVLSFWLGERHEKKVLVEQKAI